MGSLGTDDDVKPNKGTSAAEFWDAQVVDFDSQYSPSVSGEESDGINDGLQYPGATLPVDDDDVPVNNVSEMLQVEHDCETQLLNLVEETKAMDLGGETQLLLDGCYGCKEDETPFIRESDSEVKGGGNDGQDSDTTEILSDCDDGLIDKMPTNIGECQFLSSDGVKLTSPGEVGCKSAASPSLHNKVACTSGSPSPRKGFTFVRAASLRASGLSARNKMASKNYGDGVCSDMNGYKSSEQYVIGVKAKVTATTSGNLCLENLDVDDDNDTELAGLSYLNSQEPGACSQANALNFVDQFLKVSFFGYDQDAKHGIPIGQKPDPLFSGRGA